MEKTRLTSRLVLLGFAALLSQADAKSISVSFSPLPTTDGEAVNAGETSVVGVIGTEAVDGSKWNNVNLRNAATAGSPTTFIAATQGANHLDLIDSTGADSLVDVTSTCAAGGFYANYANTSNPNQANTGDGGLMQGLLAMLNTETVSLTGLAAWAPNGYKVYAFFDIGNATRTYGVSMSDGTLNQIFWTADTPTDSDTNNDGIIEWKQTTATTSAAAVTDANYAVFGNFTGNTLTISGDVSPLGSRAILNGFQIVANPQLSATINSFTATPGTFTTGQPVTLNWSVTDADSVSINQGVGTVATTGSVIVNPTASTTWTLTATRGASSVTATTTATFSLGEIDVYLLGGQSNMQGTALSSHLTPAQLSMPDIKLYAAGNGVDSAILNKLVPLQPANRDTAGVSTFGMEIGIGERLLSLRPGRPMALLKYAWSGSSLEIDWKPGANNTDTANWGPRYSAFVTTMNGGLAALEAAGWVPVIRGMCWQQGEQDAKNGLDFPGSVNPESATSAADYGANLKYFIGRIRQQFAAHAGPGGIRFVPGQVLPYAPPGGDVATRFPGRDLVRQAILNADENSSAPSSVANTVAIPTNETDHPSHAQEIDGYRDTDEVHQNAVALLAIGRSMANAFNLTAQSYLDWSADHTLVGGRNDDDDSDGLSNEQEYIFGGNPKLASDTPRPRVEMANGAAKYLVLRKREATDLVPFIQYSPDLSDWTSHPPTLDTITEQPDGVTLLIFEGPWLISDPAHSRGFFRTKGVSP